MRNSFSYPTGLILLAFAGFGLTPAVARAQTSPQDQVTFTKDVAPILQRSCQVCHRPGAMAPMSLLTYDEARPWAKSIRERVSTRAMPPWHIARNIGIQKFKNDPSLSDGEIATIVKWVDSGAPRGNPADMPPAREFGDVDQWQIGKPDLIVTSPPHVVPAEGPDFWGDYVTDAGLTEDRYIKAIQTKPSKGSHKVVHHALTYAIEDPTADDGDRDSDMFLNEYALGKNGDVFPDGTGLLLKAGTRIRFDYHYHSIGEEITDRTQLAFVFYPKGYVPKHVRYAKQLASVGDLDIPAGATDVRHDGYVHMNLAARITAFQAHMHLRGKRECLELIYPDDKRELISCINFTMSWHIVYNYADDVAPIVPKGTVLHVMTWYDNSPNNKINPDAKNWVGNGNRTIDEMGFGWISWYDLTDEEYQQELAERKALQAKATNNN